jgi:hypothetical protein
MEKRWIGKMTYRIDPIDPIAPARPAHHMLSSLQIGIEIQFLEIRTCCGYIVKDSVAAFVVAGGYYFDDLNGAYEDWRRPESIQQRDVVLAFELYLSILS